MAKKKKPLEKKKCVICGTEFMPIKGTQLCCSKECRAKRDVQIKELWYEEQRKKKDAENRKLIPKSNYEEIVDVAIAARKEGLSYGQYVAKYKL